MIRVGNGFRDLEGARCAKQELILVGVAQLVRVPDCDSGCRGFESPRSPQIRGLPVFRKVGCWYTGLSVWVVSSVGRAVDS